MEYRQRPRLHARDHMPGGADPIDFSGIRIGSALPALGDVLFDLGCDHLWQFNEDTGTTAADAFGSRDLAGSTSGTAAINWGGVESPPGTASVEMVPGTGAASFTNSGFPAMNDTFSAGVWIRMHSFGNGFGIMGQGTPAGFDVGGEVGGWELVINTDNKPYLLTESGGFGSMNGPDVISLDTWYLLGISVDASNNISLYVNGVPVATATSGISSPNGIFFGSDGSFKFGGYLAWGFTFTSTVLTDDQWFAIYNGAFPFASDAQVLTADGDGGTKWRTVAGTGGIDVTTSGTEVILDGSALGTPVEVTDGSTTISDVSEINFTVGATVSSGGAGVADVALAAGMEVTDGSTDVNPATKLTFTSGATVSDAGGGEAHIAAGMEVTDGSTDVNPATKLTFTSGATVSDAGGGEAHIAISGGGGGGGGGTDSNEDTAGTLVNATSTGDSGNRADHFTGTSLGGAWTNGYGSGASVKVKNSSLQMKTSSGSQIGVGWFQAYTPSGAFRLEARVWALDTVAMSLEVSDSTNPASFNCVGVAFQPGTGINMFHRDSGGYTQYANIAVPNVLGNWVYLALQRGASNDWTGEWGVDRNVWLPIGTGSNTLTVAYIHLDQYISSSIKAGAFDFVDVVS